MTPSRWLPPLVITFSSAIALAVLHGCQEAEGPPSPSRLAVIATKILTVKGGGTGNGVVTSVPAGINCTITRGVAATTGCIATYAKGTVSR